VRVHIVSDAQPTAEYVGASVPVMSQRVLVAPSVRTPGQRTVVPAGCAMSKCISASVPGSLSHGPNRSHPPTQLTMYVKSPPAMFFFFEKPTSRP